MVLSDKLLANKINLLPNNEKTYGRNIKKNRCLRIVICIYFNFTYIPIVILYGIINAYINILIFLISSFTKFYPYKYLFGMMENSSEILDEWIF